MGTITIFPVNLADVYKRQVLDQDGQFWKRQEKAEATRSISGAVINYLKDVMPNLFGGSADLAPSNKTAMSGAGDFSKEDRSGRNLHFGVRELAMAAIGNGIMLHGGLRAYVSTFFVFSDYCKPMARLSALMGTDVYKRQVYGRIIQSIPQTAEKYQADR